MRRWVLLLLLALTMSACRKKSAPEFYTLESEVQVLLAQEGDDAYGSPELTALEAKLAAIPSNTVEGPLAQALLTKLRADKARVLAEGQEDDGEPGTARGRGDDTGRPLFDPAPPSGAGANGDEKDAGVQLVRPFLGMPESTFLAAFGECVRPGPGVSVPGVGAATSLEVKADPDCQDRLGQRGAKTLWVFVEGSLHGTQSETPAVTTYIDAGAPPPKPPEPSPLDLPSTRKNDVDAEGREPPEPPDSPEATNLRDSSDEPDDGRPPVLNMIGAPQPPGTQPLEDDPGVGVNDAD